MARTRSENYGGMQDGILVRAAELFAAQGYERSSITDLMSACNLSRGALYHYFDSKEAILQSMLHSHVKGMLDRLRAVATDSLSPIDSLHAIVTAIVVINARSQNEQAILLNDLGSLSGKEQADIKTLEAQIVALVADALANADRSGRITRANRKVYTMMLLGIINYTYVWYDSSGLVKPEDLARMAVDVFLNGFLSAEKMALPQAARSLGRRKA